MGGEGLSRGRGVGGKGHSRGRDVGLAILHSRGRDVGGAVANLFDVEGQDNCLAVQAGQRLRQSDESLQLAHCDAVRCTASRYCILCPQPLVCLHQFYLGLRKIPTLRQPPQVPRLPTTCNTHVRWHACTAHGEEESEGGARNEKEQGIEGGGGRGVPRSSRTRTGP